MVKFAASSVLSWSGSVCTEILPISVAVTGSYLMLSVSTERICSVPRSLNGSSSQLLSLLIAVLLGMISGPRSSMLHLFGTMLYKRILWLSCLGWHAQNQLGNVCTSPWSHLVELTQLSGHWQVPCNNLDVSGQYAWSWTWVGIPAYLRMSIPVKMQRDEGHIFNEF